MLLLCLLSPDLDSNLNLATSLATSPFQKGHGNQRSPKQLAPDPSYWQMHFLLAHQTGEQQNYLRKKVRWHSQMWKWVIWACHALCFYKTDFVTELDKVLFQTCTTQHYAMEVFLLLISFQKIQQMLKKTIFYIKDLLIQNENNKRMRVQLCNSKSLGRILKCKSFP